MTERLRVALAALAGAFVLVLATGTPSAAADLRPYVQDTVVDPLVDTVNGALGHSCGIGEMCPSVCAGVGSANAFTVRVCPDGTD